MQREDLEKVGQHLIFHLERPLTPHLKLCSLYNWRLYLYYTVSSWVFYCSSWGFLLEILTLRGLASFRECSWFTYTRQLVRIVPSVAHAVTVENRSFLDDLSSVRKPRPNNNHVSYNIIIVHQVSYNTYIR